jgi:hypothetical protein
LNYAILQQKGNHNGGSFSKIIPAGCCNTVRFQTKTVRFRTVF